MKVDVLAIVGSVLGFMEMLGINARIRAYFSPQRRTQRALLFAQIAKDVLAVVKLQSGVTENTAMIIEGAITLLTERLVHEGVKPATARALAERLIAGAANGGV